MVVRLSLTSLSLSLASSLSRERNDEIREGRREKSEDKRGERERREDRSHKREKRGDRKEEASGAAAPTAATTPANNVARQFLLLYTNDKITHSILLSHRPQKNLFVVISKKKCQKNIVNSILDNYSNPEV